MCLLADRALLVRIPTDLFCMDRLDTYHLADQPLYKRIMQVGYGYTLPWKRASYRLLPVEVYDTFCSLWRQMGRESIPKIEFEEIPEQEPCPFFGDRCWMQDQLIFDPSHPCVTDHLRVVLTKPAIWNSDVEVLPWVETSSKSCMTACEAPHIMGGMPHAVGSVNHTLLEWQVSTTTEPVDNLSRSKPSPDDLKIRHQNLNITTYPFGDLRWSWSNCFVPTAK